MWTRRPSDVVVPALLATYVACFAVPAREALAAPPPATTMDDPIAQFRERFKQGMDRYKAGAPAEAIGYWEPIYRELGEQKGYRLAYDLGIAYEELGDATRAADRLQSFLAEVDARRGRSETLAAIVAKEEGDARQRMADLVATKGRISVQAGTPPAAAQVDAGEPRLAGFVAWVTPGDHAVTFAPGTPQQETKSVTVHAGEKVDVTPSPPAPPPPTTAPPSLSRATARHATRGAPSVLAGRPRYFGAARDRRGRGGDPSPRERRVPARAVCERRVAYERQRAELLRRAHMVVRVHRCNARPRGGHCRPGHVVFPGDVLA
jgi:hypothetical protein